MAVAANNLPKYAQTPQTMDAIVTAAIGSINTDTPTGVVLLFTAGVNGAILTKLSAMPRGTQATSSLVVYLARAASPLVLRPKMSELMAQYTISTGSKIPSTSFVEISELTPWRLGAGDKVYVGSQVASTAGINFTGEATDY